MTACWTRFWAASWCRSVRVWGPGRAPTARPAGQPAATSDRGILAAARPCYASRPRGRRFAAVAAALGAKSAVMTLLKRAEGDVKHQALLALAKLMTKSYAFVGVGVGVASAS